MKTVCNKKSPIGVIGPVFHSVFTGSEITTFLNDFSGPLIKRVRGEILDKKFPGYTLYSLRVIQAPNNDKSAEIVVFFKRNKESRKKPPLDMKENYEYIAFHFTFQRKKTLIYGTNRREFVDDFPVQTSLYFTLPSWNYDYRNGYHHFLQKPVDGKIAEFYESYWNASEGYYGKENQVEVSNINQNDNDFNKGTL